MNEERLNAGVGWVAGTAAGVTREGSEEGRTTRSIRPEEEHGEAAGEERSRGLLPFADQCPLSPSDRLANPLLPSLSLQKMVAPSPSAPGYLWVLSEPGAQATVEEFQGE